MWVELEYTSGEFKQSTYDTVLTIWNTRGLNLLTALTTDHERPLYMAYLGASWGLGTVLGPVIGGAFSSSSATWRWVSIRLLTALSFERH